MLWIIQAVHIGPGTENLIITNSVKWSKFTPWQSDQMEDATKMLKEKKTVTFVDPGLSLDSLPTTYTNDDMVMVAGPPNREPSMTLLTQPVNAAPDTSSRITTRS